MPNSIPQTHLLHHFYSTNGVRPSRHSIGENANLAFNFTVKDAAPVLGGTAVTAAGESVNVKVTAADGIRPKGGDYALTSGMDFTGKTVNLIDKPEWAKGARVVDGNIVLSVKPKGFMVIVK